MAGRRAARDGRVEVFEPPPGPPLAVGRGVAADVAGYLLRLVLVLGVAGAVVGWAAGRFGWPGWALQALLVAVLVTAAVGLQQWGGARAWAAGLAAALLLVVPVYLVPRVWDAAQSGVGKAQQLVGGHGHSHGGGPAGNGGHR